MSTASASTGNEHPFAHFVRILGKGKTGTRSLTQSEAKDAFGMIVRGEVEPLQLGAFLMLLRVKEETAEELAGFVQACTENMIPLEDSDKDLTADLNWSSYAGKKHQHPWFILSILLIAQAGHRVFVHGSDGNTPDRLYTEQAFGELGLPIARNWSEVSRQLDDKGFSYMPLRAFCRPLDELMQLRPLLGLRSPVNTLARLLNPLKARCALQSIFHPAYGSLHQQADAILMQPSALVFKGESGEIEIKPQADTTLLFKNEDRTWETSLGRTLQQRVPSVTQPNTNAIRQLWRGELEDDRYGVDTTLATTAVSLSLLMPHISMDSAFEQARQLWQSRNKNRLN